MTKRPQRPRTDNTLSKLAHKRVSTKSLTKALRSAHADSQISRERLADAHRELARKDHELGFMRAEVQQYKQHNNELARALLRQSEAVSHLVGVLEHSVPSVNQPTPTRVLEARRAS